MRCTHSVVNIGPFGDRIGLVKRTVIVQTCTKRILVGWFNGTLEPIDCISSQWKCRHFVAEKPLNYLGELITLAPFLVPNSAIKNVQKVVAQWWKLICLSVYDTYVGRSFARFGFILWHGVLVLAQSMCGWAGVCVLCIHRIKTIRILDICLRSLSFCCWPFFWLNLYGIC